MALVCRIKQLKLRTLSNQFKRYYFQQANGPCCSGGSRLSGSLFDQPIHRTQFNFSNNLRFFAAPVQGKPKQEEKDSGGPRLNEQITSEFVRLVIDDDHTVVSRREALERAKRLKLDLVEVQRTAKPPVCKLMDYNKERYKQQIKEKDRIKSKAESTLKSADSKEVRFTGKIEQKDLQMKADMAKRLMERGYRVKCLAMGNEDQDLKGLLSRFTELVEDIAIVESGPDKDKKGAHMIFRHVKFGPSKKGSGKKALKCEGSRSAEVQKSTSPQAIERMDIENKRSTWSDFHASDDADQVFDFSDDLNSMATSSTDEQVKVVPEAESSPANIFSVFARPEPLLESIKENTVPSPRLDPSLTKQRPQPQVDLNSSPPTANANKVGNDASSLRNLRLHDDELSKQVPLDPTVPSLKPEPSRFGIFSSPKANDTPGKLDVPSGVNRNQNGKPFNAVRNQRTGRVSENPNLPSSIFGESPRPGMDKGGEGKWGIFSRERPNVVSSKTSKNPGDTRR